MAIILRGNKSNYNKCNQTICHNNNAKPNHSTSNNRYNFNNNYEKHYNKNNNKIFLYIKGHK